MTQHAHLTKASTLAAEWDMDEADLHRLRRKHKWPHVRLGRFDVRFTDAQIAQIVQQHTAIPAGRVTASGQSRLSRGRTT